MVCTKEQLVQSEQKQGSGFIDKLIDKLPFELHVPNYQYCGPGGYINKSLVFW